jgi:tripartite-type tricarboxylate transporter receptor subunit TctC
LAFIPLAARAQAPTVEKFYADGTLIIIMGGDPGGAHDLYARVLARHMGRHIPGKPNIVVQNKTGANGLVAANFVANTAPRDGSVIAGATPASVLEPLFQEGQAAHYDSRELGWIGNIASLQLVCATWGASPVKTIADAKARTVIVGAAAPTSSSSVLPNVMNNLLGTKFKIVTGYQNSALRLAVERAEVDGVCGWAFATLEASAPDWLQQKKLNFLAQTGLKRMAQLPDVPLVSEIAETEEDKAVLRLLTYREVLGRPYFAPPGVLADRLAALRTAFAATMKDEAYLADAATSRQEINFTDYIGMQQVIADAYSVPKATLARVIALIKPPAAAK